jgi:hypothetical protein
MNLLTLQICKETAEKMVLHPTKWLDDHTYINFADTQKIQEQGRRTLEVIAEVERTINIKKKRRKFDPEREHQKLFNELNS